MKLTLIHLCLLPLFILCLSACVDDDDAAPVEIHINYEVAAIGSNAGASNELNFCGRGRYLQIIRGTQRGGSPIYTSTFGLRFEQDTVIGSIAVFVVGNDEVRDTLLSSTTGVLDNVQRIMAGSQDVDAYVELLIGHQGKVYKSVFFDSGNQQVSTIDVNAVQDIQFVVDEELLCSGSRSLIIESQLSYDGFVYNITDASDSIRVDDFRATIFNHSF